jgi:hypothetical protein
MEETMTPKEYYESCNLTENPFRPSAVAVDDPRAEIWVGYESQQKLLERLLNRVRADQVGLTSFVLLYGHWGTGKSHALLWGRHWVRKNDAGTAYYLPTLVRDKGKISFGTAIRQDLVDSGALTRDLHDYYAFLSKKILELTSAQTNMQPDDAIDKLFSIPDHRKLAKEVYHAHGQEDKLGLYLKKYLDNDHEAIQVFSKVVNLFVLEVGEANRERFKQAVYLFIDELDDLSRQPAKDSLLANDAIRHLYDSCPNCFGLIVAASAELNTLQHLFTEYVLTRMTRKVEFEFLDQIKAREFVRDILNKSRVKSSQLEKTGYFPLTEDATAEIVSHLRQITPRDVVKTMQLVLEEMRLADIDVSEVPLDPEGLERTGLIDSIFGE